MRAGQGITRCCGTVFSHACRDKFDNMTIQLIHTALRHRVYIISLLSLVTRSAAVMESLHGTDWKQIVKSRQDISTRTRALAGHDTPNRRNCSRALHWLERQGEVSDLIIK